MGVLMENKTDTEITNVEIQLVDSMSVRVSRLGAAACTVPSLQAQQQVTNEVVISISNISLPQKLKGVITYTYLGEVRKQDVVIVLPCTAFVVGEKLSKEQFAAILSGDNTLAVSSTKVVPTGDFRAAVSLITEALHVEPVQVAAGSASAYGRSILGHHVAMLVKERKVETPSPAPVSVDIKCADSTLANSLLQEINALFR